MWNTFYKMQKDARAYMQNPEIGIVCIVTSDSGFRCLSKDAAIAGKKLYFIGEERTPASLRSIGAKFIMLK